MAKRYDSQSQFRLYPMTTNQSSLGLYESTQPPEVLEMQKPPHPQKKLMCITFLVSGQVITEYGDVGREAAESEWCFHFKPVGFETSDPQGNIGPTPLKPYSPVPKPSQTLSMNGPGFHTSCAGFRCCTGSKRSPLRSGAREGVLLGGSK